PASEGLPLPIHPERSPGQSGRRGLFRTRGTFPGRASGARTVREQALARRRGRTGKDLTVRHIPVRAVDAPLGLPFPFRLLPLVLNARVGASAAALVLAAVFVIVPALAAPSAGPMTSPSGSPRGSRLASPGSDSSAALAPAAIAASDEPAPQNEP